MIAPDEWSLRRSLASDAKAILAIRAHPDIRRFQPMLPSTLEQLDLMLARRGSLPLTHDLAEKVQWTVVVDETPVGWVSLDVTSRAHHIGNIGYAIDPRCHGRGLASAAVKQVTAIALDTNLIALERIEAVAAVDNYASRRVLEKCGFRCEGIARGLLIIAGVRVDHARYELLRHDGDRANTTVETT